MAKKTQLKQIEFKIKLSIIFGFIFIILALAIICYLGINQISFGQILDPIIYLSLFIPPIICIALPFIIVKRNEKAINGTKEWEIKEFLIQKNLNLLSLVSKEFEHIDLDETCSINYKRKKNVLSYIVCIKDFSNQLREEELYEKLSHSILANAQVGYRRVIYILQDTDLDIVNPLLERNIFPGDISDFITFAHYDSSTGSLRINFTKLLFRTNNRKIIEDIFDQFITLE